MVKVIIHNINKCNNLCLVKAIFHNACVPVTCAHTCLPAHTWVCHGVHVEIRESFWESVLSYLVWSRVSRFCCWAACSRPDGLELLGLCLPPLCRSAGIMCPTFWHGLQVPELVQQVLLPYEFSPWSLMDSFCLFFYFSHLLIWQGVGTGHVMVHKWKTHYVSSKIETHTVRFGSNCLYSLSHLAS